MPGYFGDYQGPNWWDQYFYPGVAVVIIGPPYSVVAMAIYSAGAEVADITIAGPSPALIYSAGAAAAEIEGM